MPVTVGKVAIALLAGFGVYVLLFRGSGNEIGCYALQFGYSVPCEPWVAPAAGAATAGIVGLALWLNDRLRARV